MSELPERIAEATRRALINLPSSVRPNEVHDAHVALIAAMDPALGPDRLVVAGPLESELEDLRTTLAIVRGQRDEWEQIATGYRQRLQAAGIGLSNVSS